MTPDELVERVAYGWTPLEVRVHEAIYRDGRGHDVPRYLIRAAIAVALEEAAKECMDQVPGSGGEFEEGYRLACEENARNIRALIKKESA